MHNSCECWSREARIVGENLVVGQFRFPQARMYTAAMYKAMAFCLLLIPAIRVSAAQTTREPTLNRVEVKRPNVVIHGANLSKVELWAMPSG
jgi:hypothetical protein